jgi:hypothetical protein
MIISTLLEDPLRNGQLIIYFLTNQPVVQKTFKSVVDAQTNIQVALEGVKALIDIGDIPMWVASIKPEEIMQFTPSAVGLYWWLIQV